MASVVHCRTSSEREIMKKFNVSMDDYRYSYRAATETKAGRLMLQMSRNKFQAFRESDVGRQLERFVDICSQGNGWYEITSCEMDKWNRIFGTSSDGLKIWLNAFNKTMLGNVNANPYKVTVQYRDYRPTKQPIQVQRRPADQNKLAALVQRFAHA